MTPDPETWDSLPRRLSVTTASWLVDAVAPGARPGTWSVGSAPPSDLVGAARIHGVEGWVGRRADQTGIHVPDAAGAVHGAIARHQRALLDLARVEEALTASSVPFLVVKGPAVARWYAEPGLRSYVDLDVLVAPRTLGAALAALEAAGFVVAQNNWAHLQSMEEHEVTLRSSSGGAVDLHWSLGAPPLSRDRSPAFERLLARSVRLSMGATVCRGLGDVDAICHLAVHAAAAGGHRLVWLADLRAALEATQPQPEALWAAARQWAAQAAVAVMLGRTRAALGVPVPGAAGEPVRSWVGLDRLVSRLSPPERVGVGRSASRLVARSSRADSTSSVAALTGKLLLAARHGGDGPIDPAVLRRLAASRVAEDPATQLSERRAFLRWVTTARP